MNETTSNHIQKLLDDSGLIPFSKKNNQTFSSYNFSEETILITGAAGSIGSGIVNQLLHCTFKKLILIDNAESSLYYLIKELELQHNKNIDFSILDVRDEESMEWLFKTYQPTLIFHTAAYKHVSLMEDNPYEALKLNVLATKLLADLSIKYKSKKFIFISTDKAVKPISVMGTTKFIAEKYLNFLNANNETVFLTTRFGNIFGSNGSIVPLFIKQMESGRPLTITNKEVTRYFINKNKACNLIIRISMLPKLKSHVFTFNMGQPLKIIDLAKFLIELYKKKYGYKTEIKITELKPGEKLYEDIISENEMLESTPDNEIFLVVQKEKARAKSINMESLLQMTPYKSVSEIKSVLASYI
jgi:FlaA1/EpsC-like NDP-sugar epimerase